MTVADHRSLEDSARRSVGVGFKPEHFEAIVETRPELGFFEVHAENYMGARRRAASPPRRDPRALSAVAARRRPVDRLARDRSTAPIFSAWPRSPSASSRPSFPSTSPGRPTRARSSTIFSPCPIPTRRSRGCRSMSTKCRTRSGERCCSKIRRPMSCSRKARGRRRISCARSRGAPAAAFCSTSTMCS